jgi:hypothetical protein
MWRICFRHAILIRPINGLGAKNPLGRRAEKFASLSGNPHGLVLSGVATGSPFNLMG